MHMYEINKEEIKKFKLLKGINLTLNFIAKIKLNFERI